MSKIDGQNADRDLTDDRAADENWSAPFEVLRPFINARVEEADDGIGNGIMPGDVGAFVVVAGKAGQREIRFDRGAIVLLGDDVIHFMRSLVESCRHLAVLAAVQCSKRDKLAKTAVHDRYWLASDFNERRALDLTSPKKLLTRS